MDRRLQQLRDADPVAAADVADWAAEHRTPPPLGEWDRPAGPWVDPEGGVVRSPGPARLGVYAAAAAVAVVVAGGLVVAFASDDPPSDVAVIGTGDEAPTSTTAAPTTTTTAPPPAATLQEVVDAYPDVFLSSYPDGDRLVVVIATGAEDRSAQLLARFDAGRYVGRDCGVSAAALETLRARIVDHLAPRADAFSVAFDGPTCHVQVLAAGLTDAEVVEAQRAFGELVVITPVSEMTRD